MAHTLHQDPEFWLPAEFLTDQDILMDNKENLYKTKNPIPFCFPSEFPFDFDGVANSSDVEYQLAELTRQLTLHNSDQMDSPTHNYKRNHYGMASSPQSTLFQYGYNSVRSPGSSNDGTPNGPSQVSSPTSQFASSSDSIDLIYQAASQVAKLKTNYVDVSLEKPQSLQTLNSSSALYNSFVQRVREQQILKHQHQHQQQRGNVWSNNQNNGFSGLNIGAYIETDQTAWPSLQYVMQQNLQKRSGGGGSGNGYFSTARKPSAGTGVFLPRRYGTNIDENNVGGFQNNTSKKTGCSTTFLHGRGERNPHVNGGCTAQPQWQPRRGSGLCSDYDVQLAEKNAMLMRQRSIHLQRQVALGHELGLPQEWTY